MFKKLLRKIALWLKSWLGLLAPAVIIPYRGFGSQQKVILAGHVLENRLLYEAEVEDGIRQNIRSMLSRYLSTSVPEVRVCIEFLGEQVVVTTDENGLFEKIFEFDPPLDISGWQPVRYQVLDKLGAADEKRLIREGEVFIGDQESRFGLISDVDDTILVSHATNTLKKLRLILTKNAKTRLPFKGVGAFYHALQQGPEGNDHNPIFYVSSSAWNLYDFLVDFCRERDIPKGPFLLKDLKTNLVQLYKAGGGSHNHKLDKIRTLLQLYPRLSFILIGDSGQHDPALYAQAVEEFPGRILAVYIRDVAVPEKDAVVSQIADRLRTHNVPMLLAPDTAAAARHAFENGFISRQGLESVIAEKLEQDEKAESLIGQIVESDDTE